MTRDDPITLIPVPSGLGAPDAGVAGGPAALLDAGLLTLLAASGRSTTRQPALSVATGARWEALTQLCAELAVRVEQCLAAGEFPLVLGGDHAMAVGTWSGLARALDGPMGLLWIDAHLDAHTPDDSPSGNPHGMPVAMLLGEGNPRLAQPCIAPHHLCLLGGRSWEPAELARLERLGVCLYGEAEIRQRGLAVVLAEALQRVTAGTAGFGISVDLDVFRVADAPGVNSPAAGGLPCADWLTALRGLATHPACRALEIAECDPTRDPAGMTARLGCAVAHALLTPRPAVNPARESAG